MVLQLSGVTGRRMRQLLVISLLSVLLLAGKNAAALSLQYGGAKTESDKRAQQVISESSNVEQAIRLLNENWQLKESLLVRLGGVDGPEYDPEQSLITIPYGFYAEVQQRFIDDGLNLNEARRAALDALLHTVYHEMAHALIDRYQVPVIGIEEDAADALATILLLEWYPDGAQKAIHAGDLFDLESSDYTEIDEEQLAGEHSLDAQRAYRTYCLVAGADEEYAQQFEASGLFSPERLDTCSEDYQRVRSAWLRLIEDYVLSQP
ncbi:DUF4344 domain-containing metallopeptidase [Paraferrimonas haliotis]|uniref:Uncharacterized protein n=1 Tax=Paraferrimonas haliotis TaxID=2013866 RepID=A0AA37TMB2_9GAMM|nr:DUF4344 domain-containing metallopeptidase [Paraferrimonas haliotis]GLS82888.1 hypothetical protein GCM10007894_08650 [Paraferrimonas haliotis]